MKINPGSTRRAVLAGVLALALAAPLSAADLKLKEGWQKRPQPGESSTGGLKLKGDWRNPEAQPPPNPSTDGRLAPSRPSGLKLKEGWGKPQSEKDVSANDRDRPAPSPGGLKLKEGWNQPGLQGRESPHPAPNRAGGLKLKEGWSAPAKGGGLKLKEGWGASPSEPPAASQSGSSGIQLKKDWRK